RDCLALTCSDLKVKTFNIFQKECCQFVDVGAPKPSPNEGIIGSRRGVSRVVPYPVQVVHKITRARGFEIISWVRKDFQTVNPVTGTASFVRIGRVSNNIRMFRQKAHEPSGPRSGETSDQQRVDSWLKIRN